VSERDLSLEPPVQGMQVFIAYIVPFIGLRCNWFLFSYREPLKCVLDELGFKYFLILGLSEFVWVEMLKEGNFILFL